MTKLLDSTISRILIVAVIVGIGVSIWYFFSPRVLLSTSGSSSTITRYTSSFTTHGKWTVSYSYDCSNNGDDGNFAYMVVYPNKYADKSDKDVIVDGDGGSSTMHYGDSGQHKLFIIGATCPWSVVVKGSLISL